MIMINEQPQDSTQELLDKLEQMKAIEQRLDDIFERQSSIIEQLERLREEQFQAGVKMSKIIFSEASEADAVKVIIQEIEAIGGEMKRLEDQLKEIMVETQQLRDLKNSIQINS